MIRTLKSDEVECRVQSVKKNGCVLLIYKDARADMRVLDEVYGIDGWQRSHELINGNLFCTVEIWSKEKNQWIKKQDVGTESMTEKQKGEASDSFKRACFNIGIGRELYSSPFIWIGLNESEITESNGKYSLKFGVKFHVKEIESDEQKNIIKLTICDEKKVERFKFNINGLKEKQKETTDFQKKIVLSKKILDSATTLDLLKTIYLGLEKEIRDNLDIVKYKDELKLKLTPKQ
jgi:hypothetical protein